MSRRLDHKCLICGEMYESCDSCEKIKTYTPWRSLCDTFHCYSIYLAIRSYQENLTTKDEAQKELMNLGITSASDYENWTDGTKKCLDEILSTPKRKSYKKDVVVEEETTEPTAEIVEE